MMDIKVLGGLLFVLVLVVGAGVSIYLENPNIGMDSAAIVANNNDISSNTNSFQTAQSETMFSSKKNKQTPTSGPSLNPGQPLSVSKLKTNNTLVSTNSIVHMFDKYLKSSYDQSLIPGMAVVVVKNNKIIYQKCLGVKDLRTKQPVDPDTLFGICSISKQFTSTNIAQYVSHGSMNWNDPIVKYYPNPNHFKLYNNYVTNHLTIKDCFCHRSGYPADGGDDLYTFFNNTYLQTLQKYRYMKNDTPFRSTFAYNNVIYCLPAYAAAHTTKTYWNVLIKKDLLHPLGMTHTATSYYEFMKSKNHATPIELLKNGAHIPYDIIPDPVAPAGSIYSSINDMAHWLKFQINDTGIYHGLKLVNKKELDQTKTPQKLVTGTLSAYGSKYGSGWFINDLNINHPGDSDSFHAMISIFPKNHLGIVILTNGGVYASTYRDSLYAKFGQLIRGKYNYDSWPESKKAIAKVWKPTPAKPPIKATLMLKDYVGIYNNKLYGNIRITTYHNKLICHYGANKQAFALKPWNGNVFEDNKNSHTFNFTHVRGGKAQQVDVKLTFTPENITFTRKH